MNDQTSGRPGRRRARLHRARLEGARVVAVRCDCGRWLAVAGDRADCPACGDAIRGLNAGVPAPDVAPRASPPGEDAS